MLTPGKLSILELDFSAGFDTIDFGMVINKLSKWVGISGSAPNGSNRKFSAPNRH